MGHIFASFSSLLWLHLSNFFVRSHRIVFHHVHSESCNVVWSHEHIYLVQICFATVYWQHHFHFKCSLLNILHFIEEEKVVFSFPAFFWLITVAAGPLCVSVQCLMGNPVLCLANHVRHLNHRGPKFLWAIPACHHECKDRIYPLRPIYEHE